MDRSIPPLILERAALGELSPSQIREYQEKFGPEFDQALQRLLEQDQSWSKAPERERELQQIRARVGQMPRPQAKRRWMYLSATACACAALFVVLRPGPDPLTQDRIAEAVTSDPSIRLKGLAPYLTLHRKVDQGQEQLSSGSRAGPGDLIQLSYVAAGANFGVVISIDGRGHTTLHFPKEIGESTQLDSNGAVPLERAYELDDAPHFERFFFVTARGKTAPKDFARRVFTATQAFAQQASTTVQTADLALPASWSQADFLLKKEQRPS